MSVMSYEKMTRKFLQARSGPRWDEDEQDTIVKDASNEYEMLERFLAKVLQETDINSTFHRTPPKPKKYMDSLLSSKGKRSDKENWRSHKEIDEETNMTFKPQLISNNDRYLGQNNQDFLTRNEMWQEVIKQKRVSRVEDKAQLDQLTMIKTCTFKPQINKQRAKSKRTSALPSKEATHTHTRRTSFIQENIAAHPEPAMDRRSFNQAVTLLHQQLHELDL